MHKPIIRLGLFLFLGVLAYLLFTHVDELVAAGTGFFTNSGQNNIVTSSANGVELADLDGDGDLDVFTSGRNSHAGVWLNRGGVQGGTEGEFVRGQVFTDFSTAIALDDLDNDGDIDGVLMQWSNRVNLVLRNNGNGTFAIPQVLAGNDGFDVELGDVNGDGYSDMITIEGSGNYVYYNNGNGTFTNSGQNLITDVIANLAARQVALDDVDNDGDLDAFIIVSTFNGFGRGNEVWINQGGTQGGTEGIFADSGLRYGTTRDSQYISPTDADSDGDTDFLVYFNYGYHMWINQGGAQGGTLGTYAEQSLPFASGIRHVTFGDFDEDGDEDAFLVSPHPTTRDEVWFNQGNATYSDSGQRLNGGESNWRAAVGDMDGDNDLDVFIIGGSGEIWLNNDAPVPPCETAVFINFQPSTATTPTGYHADTGHLYGDRGDGCRYGWTVDNQANARDRDGNHTPDQRYDTLNHMQLGGIDRAWEIEVADGTYFVHAVAGDGATINPSQRIDAEGVSLIDGQPRVGQQWIGGSAVVSVTDGRLTLSNSSSATGHNKLNFVHIIPVDGASTPFSAQINFQQAGDAIPAGYEVDAGTAFGLQGNGLTYGWDVDNSGNSRDRNHPNALDQRYDTLNHLQLNGPRTWEIAVPNGTYAVTIAGGDPQLFHDVRIYGYNVEGVQLIDGDGTPTPHLNSRMVSAVVEVTDGQLTVTNGATAVANKIQFIHITQVSN